MAELREGWGGLGDAPLRALRQLPSWCLDLYAGSRRVAAPVGNDEKAMRALARILDDLPEQADGVDDGRTGRIRLEIRKWFQRASAFLVACKCKDVRVPRREPGNHRLQHLDQTLIEKRHLARSMPLGRQKRERHFLAGEAEWREVRRLRTVAHLTVAAPHARGFPGT